MATLRELFDPTAFDAAVQRLPHAEAAALLDHCSLLSLRLQQHVAALAEPVSDDSCRLLSLPPDVLVRIIALLPTVEDVGRLDCVCRAFHCDDVDAPKDIAPPADAPADENSSAAANVPPAPIAPTACACRPTASLVEEALRLRAASGGYTLAAELPEGEASWTQKLCWDELRRRFGPRAVAAGGMYHSLLIEGGGTLLTCGSSTLDGGRPGLLGHGDVVERLEIPTPVPSLARVQIRSVAAAEYHSIAIADSGAAYSWGYGGLGRLGHGDELDQYTPREIRLPADAGPALSASAGNCHSILLTASGAAFSFGYAGSGRLGLGARGNDTRALSPEMMSSLRGVHLQSAAAGTYHTLLLAASGSVYSCGEGGLGQLGHGSCENESAPRPIEALTREGVVVCAVAAGRLHSLCLTDEGKAYSWGEGDDGRLGHGDGESCFVPRLIRGFGAVRLIGISSVWDHSIALSDTGRVYSWGLGLCGQLGHGDEQENVESPKLVQGLQGSKMAAVAAGAHHCFAVGVNGCLFGWGVGKTTEEDAVDALGLRLQSNQCQPLQYLGLRLNRPALERVTPA